MSSNINRIPFVKVYVNPTQFLDSRKDHKNFLERNSTVFRQSLTKSGGSSTDKEKKSQAGCWAARGGGRGLVVKVEHMLPY